MWRGAQGDACPGGLSESPHCTPWCQVGPWWLLLLHRSWWLQGTWTRDIWVARCFGWTAASCICFLTLS